MMQKLEDITDRRGRSIGCILFREDMIMAIRPNGESRECGYRAAAVYWLKEKDAGRDPDLNADKPDVVDYAVLAVTLIFIGFYIYLWLRG